MFQFPGFALSNYEFIEQYHTCGGLPHSDIHGSKGVRTSPWLFAAYYVLHRLSVPRHPPDALLRLIFSSQQQQDSSCRHTQNKNNSLHLRIFSFSDVRNDKFKEFYNLVKFLYLYPIYSFKDQQTFLVEVNGIEPMTSCLQSTRSPN